MGNEVPTNHAAYSNVMLWETKSPHNPHILVVKKKNLITAVFKSIGAPNSFLF